jgi:hypothetical protein
MSRLDSLPDSLNDDGPEEENPIEGKDTQQNPERCVPGPDLAGPAIIGIRIPGDSPDAAEDP